MSPRVFDGWAATEVHEHFDIDGNLTGRTVVTREPEWDDGARARALGLDEFEQALCPCGCGLPYMESTEPGRRFSIKSETCLARQAIGRAQRRASKAAENKDPGSLDGTLWYVAKSLPPRDKPTPQEAQ